MGFGAINVDLQPGSIIKAIFDGIDSLITSDEEKETLKAKALQEAREGDLKEWAIRAGLLTAQAEINKAEASTASNVMAATWRPAVGWTCALALFYQFVASPVGVWAAAIAGYPVPAPPSLDGMLWELLFGMLGIAGFRTFEKSKGVL